MGFALRLNVVFGGRRFAVLAAYGSLVPGTNSDAIATSSLERELKVSFGLFAKVCGR
jgi:hypothetical protein